MKQYFEILELQPGATPDEVKTAYRDLAKVWHPDRFKSDSPRLKSKAAEKLAEINEAYEKIRAYQARQKSRKQSGETHSVHPQITLITRDIGHILQVQDRGTGNHILVTRVQRRTAGHNIAGPRTTVQHAPNPARIAADRGIMPAHGPVLQVTLAQIIPQKAHRPRRTRLFASKQPRQPIRWRGAGRPQSSTASTVATTIRMRPGNAGATKTRWPSIWLPAHYLQLLLLVSFSFYGNPRRHRQHWQIILR